MSDSIRHEMCEHLHAAISMPLEIKKGKGDSANGEVAVVAGVEAVAEDHLRLRLREAVAAEVELHQAVVEAVVRRPVVAGEAEAPLPWEVEVLAVRLPSEAAAEALHLPSGAVEEPLHLASVAVEHHLHLHLHLHLQPPEVLPQDPQVALESSALRRSIRPTPDSTPAASRGT